MLQFCHGQFYQPCKELHFKQAKRRRNAQTKLTNSDSKCVQQCATNIAHVMFGFHILWIQKNLQFSSCAFELRSYCRSNVNRMHYNHFSCFSAHSIAHCLFISSLKSYFYRIPGESWIHTNATWWSLTIFQKLVRW